jgi:branched-subunit amino acid transport protein
MSLSWRARRRLALVVLLVGLPLYIVLAVTVIDWFDRPSGVVEFLIYVVLGVLWALPFRTVFRGIGREENSAKSPPDEHAR